ncbi:hypothetical protein LEP1GSC050_0463 [Leptospira broomii serovar Hurstbridge str. 5399]|uniref:Uncharacterized protein n=1 Tax=Leptospira broomii serovar Hurstbridge str. 5399 TaxID=1049789 RepID=T0F6A2_9LEPT|nr:hypothetical protein LEP1GSC050_0463 [Leptospira broomii serovar Hurstbridge str. 5399]
MKFPFLSISTILIISRPGLPSWNSIFDPPAETLGFSGNGFGAFFVFLVKSVVKVSKNASPAKNTINRALVLKSTFIL